MNRRNRHDAILVLIALVGLAAALVLLRLDISLANGPGAGQSNASSLVIAQTRYATAGSRRRAAAALVWDRLRAVDPLKERDSVFVPQGGSVKLTFLDGAQLEIDENSLVVIEQRVESVEGPQLLELVAGSVTGRAGPSGMEIRAEQGNALLAREALAQVAVGPSLTRVQTRKGLTQLEAHEQRIDVVAGEMAQSTALGVSQAVKFAARLRSPEHEQRVYCALTACSVELSWGALGSQASLRMQIADDPLFTKVLVNHEIHSQGSYTFQSKVPGIYWWRLVDAEGLPQSEVRRFTTAVDAAPIPISPLMDNIVYVPPDHGFMVRWGSTDYALRYEIEIAQDTQFTTVVLRDQPVAAHLWVNGSLPEGFYYWRVRAQRDNAPPSPYGAAIRFRLINKPVPEAPVTQDAVIRAK
ncbi:MAG: hypothetical protein R3C68_14075 [Myxococcota bacterium]